METKDIIRNRRIELGYTMKELAEKAGVNEATISRWESGDIANMRRNKIIDLARALQIPPMMLMEMESTEPEDKEPGFEEALQVFTRSRKNLTKEQRMELARKILEESDDE
jgi:transcriptional regulator with XRE-family HTH domain